MGRTNPTYRDALAQLEAEWKPMRRALRREYQHDFDRLFDRARGYADAAGYANPPDPERALVLSLLLAHEAEIRRLNDRLDELERSHQSGTSETKETSMGADTGTACDCTHDADTGVGAE
ncbi:hypothetical protein Halru_0692 [Halovivax ruber XH-70]|uniref:DUF8156 domain-containing protein n=1 Tax=Halovivax ruber (strain DSM 18193 / JCM 13892 / XH-70) TaxID=797302 RepID=L0I9F0_HALRX|nr:hypothetical protein [Halovivax ruber]AGB15319.1 hypothetical protein Halru_0692 [Halovivax ruber XH-70]